MAGEVFLSSPKRMSPSSWIASMPGLKIDLYDRSTQKRPQSTLKIILKAFSLGSLQHNWQLMSEIGLNAKISNWYYICCN